MQKTAMLQCCLWPLQDVQAKTETESFGRGGFGRSKAGLSGSTRNRENTTDIRGYRARKSSILGANAITFRSFRVARCPCLPSREQLVAPVGCLDYEALLRLSCLVLCFFVCFAGQRAELHNNGYNRRQTVYGH